MALALLKEGGRLGHLLSRVKTYKNWYSIVWPFTRLLLSSERILKTRLGSIIYVRNIFGPDFTVVHEMFYRDDYQTAALLHDSIYPVVLDLGANIGAFSLLVYNRNKNSRIFAFEPDIDNLEIIKKNIELNKASAKIKVFPLAVADTIGKKEFFLSKDAYAHSFEKDQVSATLSGSTIVESITIERILQDNNIDRVDLIKIDIEGSEFSVLYNLPDYVYDKIKCIVLEIHKSQKYNKDDLIMFLVKHGYIVQQSDKHSHVYLANRIKRNN